MPNFISENDIELAMVQRLQHLYGYDTLNGNTADPVGLNDDSRRTDKREVILHDRLKTHTPPLPAANRGKALFAS
ncbi:MAG: hypothetical protein ABQ298_00540 [Puniceicoccaceae bacterium]